MKVLVVVALLAACDPGGTYRARDSIPSDGDLLVFGSDIWTHTSVTWFTASLWVHVAITNNGATPLVVRPNDLTIGIPARQFPRKDAFELRCREHDNERSVTLVTGQTCQVDATFEVGAEIGRDHDLPHTLTLMHAGVSRAGRPVAIEMTLDEL